MTSKAKQTLDKLPTIGYWSTAGGIEVKEIYDQAGATYCRCISNAWHGRKRYHNVQVHYTAGGKFKESRAYILIDGMRYYFEDCLRA